MFGVATIFQFWSTPTIELTFHPIAFQFQFPRSALRRIELKTVFGEIVDHTGMVQHLINEIEHNEKIVVKNLPGGGQRVYAYKHLVGTLFQLGVGRCRTSFGWQQVSRLSESRKQELLAIVGKPLN